MTNLSPVSLGGGVFILPLLISQSVLHPKLFWQLLFSWEMMMQMRVEPSQPLRFCSTGASCPVLFGCLRLILASLARLMSKHLLPSTFQFQMSDGPPRCRWSYGWCHYLSGTETEAPGVLIGQLMNRSLGRVQWWRRWWWWAEAARRFPILIFSVVESSESGCWGLAAERDVHIRSSSPGVIRAWQNQIHGDNVKSLAWDNETKAWAGRPFTVFHILSNLPSYMALFYGFIAWAPRLTLT